MINEQSFREFLLGTSNPESELRIEEGILDGSVEPDLLLDAEDELIDDYLFGKLTELEQLQFRGQFLFDHKRRERLEFAKALVQHANSKRGPVEIARPGSMVNIRAWGAIRHTAALVAMAALVVVAVLVGLQNWRLSNEVQLARSSQDEVNRLRAALAAEKSRQAPSPSATTREPTDHSNRGGLSAAGSVAAFDLQPGATRGLKKEVVLQVPSRTLVVWFNLEFSDPLSGRLREELAPRGVDDPLWIQEFTVSSASPLTANSIAVPSAVLPPGDYVIRVKQNETDTAFQDVQSYSFRVIR